MTLRTLALLLPGGLLVAGTLLGAWAVAQGFADLIARLTF